MGNDFGSNGDHVRNTSICSGFASVSALTHYHKRSCLLSDSAAYCTRKLDISGRRRSVTSEHDQNKGLYRVSACFHNIVRKDLVMARMVNNPYYHQNNIINKD